MNQLQGFSGAAVKSSSVIGTDVVDLKGQNLGEIKDIVIDPMSGRIAYAVVAFGGFLGMGEKLFAIPYTSFDYTQEYNQYILDIDKKRLENAPGFDPDHWPLMSDEKWHRDVYAYYGAPVYWEL